MADAQKQEKPTQRRLNKAREEGNFPSSRQFISGVQFLAFVAMLRFFGGRWFSDMGIVMGWLLRRAFSKSLTLNDWMSLVWQIALHCILPLLIAAAALLTI